VRVFRVHVNADYSCVDFHHGDEYTFRQLAVLPGGWTAPQARVSCDYGFLWLCIALNYNYHESHTALLRCYRPGYETVELGPWDLRRTVTWKAAPDPAAQEKAVDDLVATPGHGWAELLYDSGRDESRPAWRKQWPILYLRPGSASAGHREALLIAAAEYERLAALVPPGGPAAEEAHGRLTEKALSLRERAGE
jgi:hypothetical protein